MSAGMLTFLFRMDGLSLHELSIQGGFRQWRRTGNRKNKVAILLKIKGGSIFHQHGWLVLQPFSTRISLTRENNRWWQEWFQQTKLIWKCKSQRETQAQSQVKNRLHSCILLLVWLADPRLREQCAYNIFNKLTWWCFGSQSGSVAGKDWKIFSIIIWLLFFLVNN